QSQLSSEIVLVAWQGHLASGIYENALDVSPLLESDGELDTLRRKGARWVKVVDEFEQAIVPSKIDPATRPGRIRLGERSRAGGEARNPVSGPGRRILTGLLRLDLDSVPDRDGAVCKVGNGGGALIRGVKECDTCFDAVGVVVLAGDGDLGGLFTRVGGVKGFADVLGVGEGAAQGQDANRSSDEMHFPFLTRDSKMTVF
ncbi:hypothetical protein B0T11DRAFT_347216, partial [Plectosphaerella cucumerina]